MGLKQHWQCTYKRTIQARLCSHFYSRKEASITCSEGMSVALVIQHAVRMRRTIQNADKSLARPGRKQATATEDFDFHIPYL